MSSLANFPIALSAAFVITSNPAHGFTKPVISRFLPGCEIIQLHVLSHDISNDDNFMLFPY
jgi:hypothetical protein